jgi:hypothetical protein
MLIFCSDFPIDMGECRRGAKIEPDQGLFRRKFAA